MFECVLCAGRYTLVDVEDGQFFPSTRVCLRCYIKMYKNKTNCFGDKEKYNMKELPCQECPDNRLCRSFVKYRKEFIK